MQKMASPILWQTTDRRATLLDVLRSVESAQNLCAQTPERRLISSPPLLTPFPSQEPKSASAKAKLKTNTVDAVLHSTYRNILHEAIEEVKRYHDGNWCFQRCLSEEPPAKKRKFGEDSYNERRERATLSETFLPNLARAKDTNAHQLRFVTRPDSNSEPSTDDSLLQQLDGHFFANKNGSPALLRIISANVEDSLRFYVPPRACFYLGDCADSKAFHASVRNQAERAGTTRAFNFILLDPPWPNRSVKRTRKTAGSTYATTPSLWDMRELLLDTKLDLLMAEACLVAVWITNKPAVRELVLGEEGSFACWDVELVEEWLWLKTTKHGEPVSPIDALWRKPYEVLLLGRKRRKSSGALGPDTNHCDVKRRVLISVPDLHSRKPCLKELIEPLMDDPEDYRALEVFARHLVAGWWSWGDECIKFNWEVFWREEFEST